MLPQQTVAAEIGKGSRHGEVPVHVEPGNQLGVIAQQLDGVVVNIAVNPAVAVGARALAGMQAEVYPRG